MKIFSIFFFLILTLNPHPIPPCDIKQPKSSNDSKTFVEDLLLFINKGI